MNLYIKQKQTRGYEKQTWLPNYKERGSGINSEYWINRYK